MHTHAHPGSSPTQTSISSFYSIHMHIPDLSPTQKPIPGLVSQPLKFPPRLIIHLYAHSWPLTAFYFSFIPPSAYPWFLPSHYSYSSAYLRFLPSHYSYSSAYPWFLPSYYSYSSAYPWFLPSYYSYSSAYLWFLPSHYSPVLSQPTFIKLVRQPL
jgi:hypothetical protein